METQNIVNNVFMHDAVPTWSGFLYQGRIAVYLAVKKIIELNEAEIEKYALEMEKCEDIAIVYIDGSKKNTNRFIRLRMKSTVRLEHIKIH